MMRGLRNIFKREASRVSGQQALVRMAIVTSYDPNNYAAKVEIQPEGHETGFLPIASIWVGNGWGMLCPPSPGDVVDVHFQEGGRDAAYISLRFFGDQIRPVTGVNSGDFLLQHQSGHSLLLTSGGVIINVNGNVRATISGSVLMQASEFDLIGDVNVTGNIFATGDITDQNGDSGTVQNIRNVFDSHTHAGVQTGGGDTAIPNQIL